MVSKLHVHAKTSKTSVLGMPKAQTMPDLLAELAQHQGSKTAVIDEFGQITFSDLYTRSNKLALGLSNAGVRPGDRVGLIAGNGIDWLTVFFGAGMAGATAVLFNTWVTLDELSFLVKDSDCSIIFGSNNFNGRDFTSDLLAIMPDAGAEVIVIGDTQNALSRTLESLLNEVAERPLKAADPQDDAMILYTSGSTSRPKGVRLIHSDLIESGYHIGRRQGLRPGDRVFVPVPLFWAFGGANALPTAFTHAATLVLPQRFDAGRALTLIEKHRCTAIYTLPSITVALIQHIDFSGQRVESLRTGLTIGSPQDFRSAVERLGILELCNVYGSTETYGNCAVTPHDWPLDRRAICQGMPLPGQELRFRDTETDALLTSGEIGLAEVGGRIFPGYFNKNSAENESAFTPDGYYRTGDLGYLDTDGSFVFVGRASEMIKRAGINVSPAEVEDVLLKFDGVSTAAVVGISDLSLGEVIVAYVTCRDQTIDTDKLRAHCVFLLSKYKLPDHIEIVGRLPVTVTGKLQRKAVKEMARVLMSVTTQRDCA